MSKPPPPPPQSAGVDSTIDRLVASAVPGASADRATGSSSEGGSSSSFVASTEFVGPKVGYYFGTVSGLGTGYHLDVNAADFSSASRGRKRPPDENDDDESGSAKKRSVRFGSDSHHPIPSRQRPKTGEELLAEAEEAQAAAQADSSSNVVTTLTLDASGIKSAALALERAINRNQLDRAQHPTEPTKFMESELVLNDVVTSFKDVAANVGLYTQLVTMGTVTSLVGLLGHDNVDVAASVLGVLVELMDVNLVTGVDAPPDAALSVGALARAVLHGSGAAMDMVSSNVGRFDEEVEEERTGLDDALSLVEGLLDVDLGGMVRVAAEAEAEGEEGEKDEEEEGGGRYRSVARVVLTSTTLLTWLLERVGRNHGSGSGRGKQQGAAAPTSFSPIALHASEVLSSLLQHDDARVYASNLGQLAPYRSAFDDDDDDNNFDSKPRAKPTSSAANGTKSSVVVNGMECLLQAIAPYRKADPRSEEEVEFVENVMDALSASLQSPDNVTAFLDGQGVELMLRLLREGRHGGGGALKVLYFATSGPSSSSSSSSAPSAEALNDGPAGGGGGATDPYKLACETLVEAGGLRTIFPIFMGRGSAIPKPAPCSDAGRGLLAATSSAANNGEEQKKKMGKRARRAEAARKQWSREVEGNVVRVVYELTRHLDERSPNEGRDRVLTKFLEGDCEKCDRLVELILKYDEQTRLAEYQYYRSDEAEEMEGLTGTTVEDVDLAALNAKLRGGGDVLHRVCAVAAFACVGSKRCHQHILEQLGVKNSGMGVLKSALEEFTAMLDEGSQKKQLMTYLSAL